MDESVLLVDHILLDDLDLFNKEGTDDSILNGLSREMSSISTGYSSLSLRDTREGMGPHKLNTS